MMRIGWLQRRPLRAFIWIDRSRNVRKFSGVAPGYEVNARKRLQELFETCRTMNRYSIPFCATPSKSSDRSATGKTCRPRDSSSSESSTTSSFRFMTRTAHWQEAVVTLNCHVTLDRFRSTTAWQMARSGCKPWPRIKNWR